VALWWLLLTFSILGGIGIGIAYVCPIATCVKWFPDKRGLITGLAVAGFGRGLLLRPLAKGLIIGGPYQMMGVSVSSDLPKIGVFHTFATLGVIFLVAVVLGARSSGTRPRATFPPAGPRP